MGKQALFISTALLALFLVVMGIGCRGPSEKSDKEITVGNKNFTEQDIVGQLIKQLLEDRGFTVNLKSGRSSMYLREAMKFGDIDVYAEYTGTAWMVHLAHQYKSGMDNNEVYDLVKEEDKANGFVWLNSMWNNNTFALASWPEFAREHGLNTLSDLAALYRKRAGEIKTCVGLEFSTRRDGLLALENHYNFEVAKPHFIITKPVEAPKQYLEKRQCEVAMVFGTDPEAAKYDWHVYMDDKAFFPPYDLAPYVRKDVLDKYPEIKDILNELVGTFPGGGGTGTPEIVKECQKTWQELNAKVSIDKMKPEQVAREYLIKNGLIKR